MMQYIVATILLLWTTKPGQAGRVLDPIYWTTSNAMFRSQNAEVGLNVDIDDKVDIICPKRGRDEDENLFHYKLYLVSAENFDKCNVIEGRRLLTCNIPNKEKKYTFYFQEISPSPWGLEFRPHHSYYVISTSDGTPTGMDIKKGGVCTQFQMKVKLVVHEKGAHKALPSSPAVEDNKKPLPKHPYFPPVVSTTRRPRVVVAHSNSNAVRLAGGGQQSNLAYPEVRTNNNNVDISNDNVEMGNGMVADSSRDDYQLPVSSSDSDQPPVSNDNNNNTTNFEGNGLPIGIVLGACAVLFLVFLVVVAHNILKRRRNHKKYPQGPAAAAPSGPPLGHTQALQQVTLLPIGHQHQHPHYPGSLLSDYHRSQTLTSHRDLRPPPSYNESLLSNGGPVVAV